REVIELGFKTKLVEKVDLDFHVGIPAFKTSWPLLSVFSSGKTVLLSFRGSRVLAQATACTAATMGAIQCHRDFALSRHQAVSTVTAHRD
ncbi:MAG TPA: hypothetical protein PLH47_13345, partial [Ottowia sp.]|nr:hypothetical protein [Ottowia sp.]